MLNVVAMFGKTCDTDFRYQDIARRGLCMCLCLGVVLSLVGCNQNPSATGYNAFANPFAQPAANSTSQQYMDQMRQQAQQQYLLAMQQQQRLAELETMQRQSEQQLAQMRQQEQDARARAEQLQEQEQEQLVQRAREFLGRYDDLGSRAQNLDRNNQDLHAQIARVQQRTQLLEDQNHLLRQRLEDTTQQLADALEANRQSQQRLQTVMASSQRRSGATITANNSYRRKLTAVTVAGLSVRQDGELVRIELPADQIFGPESATLLPSAATQLDQVAEVIRNHYPRQVIGVEAHTDRAPANTAVWRNAHQLTAAQATAVFEQLSYRNRLLPQQMFVMGHGANFALASNATEAGRARNRRIEIVIYPDTLGQRQ